MVHIYADGASDTSGNVKLLEISSGANTISGTLYGIEIGMNANTESGITIAKGAMTMTDGALTLSSGNFTMSSGNADITGTMTVSGTSALQNITASGTYTGQGVMILDGDNAEMFLIRENGDAADVLTVDTTQDAGDTTMLLTTKVTTGTGLHIDGSTITTGDALKITVAAATMTAAGAAISVVADGSEVFAIRDDGSGVSIAGTAEGTTALGVTTGDVVITDGDLTVAGGEVAFTSDSTTAGLVMVNNTITTAASFVDLSSTSLTTGAMMRINANNAGHDGEILELISAGDSTSTPVGLSITIASPTTGAARGIEVTMVGATTTAKGIAVTMDALTTGDMLYLDNGGSTLTEGSGFYINCNDDNASDFTVGNYGETDITGKAAGTAALTIALGDIVVTDTDATTITSVNGTGSIVEIISGGAIGADKACLEIDAAGTFNADGSLLRLSAEGVTASNAPAAMQIDCAALDMTGINIVSSPTTGSGMLITVAGVLAADKAALELVGAASGSNADSAVLRITQDHTGGASFCANLKQDDLDVGFINFEGTASADALSPISTLNTTAAATDHIRVAINGVKFWLPGSTTDPS